MATQDGWAEAPMVREQMVLFPTAIDDMIPDDHEVRLLDELLRSLDWSDWEAEYSRHRGQPPIHPRILAGIWLYGLSRKIKTSRPLEYACEHNVDFIWLAEGRKPDHSTLAAFLTKFKAPLKDMFRQVVRVALSMGLVRLGEVAFDGTRVKAHNNRYATLNAKSIEERLAKLDEIIDEAEAASSESAAENSGRGSRLPDDLSEVKARKEIMEDALNRVKELNEQRKKGGLKTPGQVPMTDPESRVMQNKEGGYAPNYTPTALTDGHVGIILEAGVCDTVNEHREALPALDAAIETCDGVPEAFTADCTMSTGAVLEGLEERGITGYIPTESSEPAADSPVRRADLTQPVAEEHWSELPKNNQGKLDRSNFVYDEERDEYRCPMGRALRYSDREMSEGNEIRRFRCVTCEGCALVPDCLQTRQNGDANEADGRVRSIRRDSYTKVRNRMADRMSEEPSKEIFNQRSWIAETPFGYLKGILGLRQFQRVGLEKVEQEWRWACMSLNVKKILKCLRRLRALAKVAIEEHGEIAAEGA